MTLHPKPLNVAFVIFNEVEALDLNGPLDVFVKANALKPQSFHNYLVSCNSEPVYTEAKTTTLIPHYTFENCPNPDIVVVPGANPDIVMAYLNDPAFQASYTPWIVKMFQNGSKLFTVCTGSLLLANTPIFNGKKITSHFMVLDLLREMTSEYEVITDVRFVDDGNVITSAGITAGIDAAIHVVSTIVGNDIGATIAKLFEYPLQS